MDKTLEAMMKKHIDESPLREQKLTVLEESNKNIIRSLATGDNNFKELRESIQAVDRNIVKILHTLHGNGVPGLCQKVELHLKRIDDIEKGCVVGKTLIDKVNAHDEFIARTRGVFSFLNFLGFNTILKIALMIGVSVGTILGVLKVFGIGVQYAGKI